tara:strand:- start:4183 stop:4884 length:702 start_codon:yes stop_codon:yes gene_type:complete
MNNQTLQIKLKQRLNKLASNDYDNIECWQIVEAFNKAQVEWARRQLHGNNMYREGDEMSKRRIDDLQILLEERGITGTPTTNYFESTGIPADYLEYKRITAYATSECCPDPRSMTVYLAEEANVDLLMRDPLKRPDYDWGETYCTWIGDKVRVYKRDFDITSVVLTYYRQPILIQIQGCQNPYDGTTSATNIICEFKDDIVEVLLDETASLIAGDIDNFNQYQINQQSAERNN